jgi:general secretion pathway protein C
MLTLFYRCLPIYYVLLCALLGLSLAWFISSESDIRLRANLSSSSISAEPSAVKLNRTPADNRIVLQRNVFNSNQSAKAATIVTSHTTGIANQQLQIAPDNLKLVGTVVAGNDSLAVIKSNENIEILRLRQHISGGGILNAVMRDHVEIESSDGTCLILEMSPAVTNNSAAVCAKSKPASVAKQQLIAYSVDNNRWVIPAAIAAEARENIAEIVKHVRLTPNVVGGKTQGFIIKWIRRNSLFSQMGLKRGDILHAINGTTLDSPEKGLQIFQQLREARTLNVDLKRGSKSMNFKYEIK